MRPSLRLLSLVLAAATIPGCGSDMPPAATARAPTTTASTTASASASPAAQNGSGDVAVDWSQLARPLNLPRLAADRTCPRSIGHQVSAAFGAAAGDGPIYPVGLGADGILNTVLRDGLYQQKVLWLGAPSYQGPVLIRGSRLDGAGTVQFALGDVGLVPELKLMEPTASSSDGPAGWREWPSSTAVPNPGCYAYQVDGTNFTTVIVFEART